MLIGEVARLSGVSARMLRHYEEIGLVTPSDRTSGGYREYGDADLRRLFEVESLRSLGLSLAEVAATLDADAVRPDALIDQLIARTRERMRLDEELLERLDRVRSVEPSEWTDVPRLVALLTGLASRDPSQRQRAALRGNESGDSLVAAVLTEDDPNVAGAVQWALARSGEDTLPALVAALHSGDPATRLRAVEAIVKLEGPAPIAALRGELDHQDPAVRRRSALAVGASGDPVALEVLIPMVVDGNDDVVAAEVLGRLAQGHHLEESVAALLEREFLAASDPDVRVRIVQALAEIPGPAAGVLAERAATDADARVSITARYVLRLKAGASGDYPKRPLT